MTCVFWRDEAKSPRNLDIRGFDFEFAPVSLMATSLRTTTPGARNSERRVVSIGEVDGEILTVVHTWRGVNRRIISARHANRRERNAYRKAFGQGNS